MAELDFFQDLNGQGVVQLKGMRIQNVADQTAQDAYVLNGNFGDELGLDNTGLEIYRSDLKRVAVWDGAEFVFQEIQIEGDVIFKGIVDASISLDGQSEAVAGFTYVVGTAGTLSMTGVTFSPSDFVEVGDKILFVSETEAYVIQANIDANRITVLENRVDTVEAKNLEQDGRLDELEARGEVKTFFQTLSLAAGVNTITHGLALTNAQSYTINVQRNNSTISVDVDSVDVNSLTLTTLLPLTDVTVAIIGF